MDILSELLKLHTDDKKNYIIETLENGREKRVLKKDMPIFSKEHTKTTELIEKAINFGFYDMKFQVQECGKMVGAIGKNSSKIWELIESNVLREYGRIQFGNGIEKNALGYCLIEVFYEIWNKQNGEFGREKIKNEPIFYVKFTTNKNADETLHELIKTFRDATIKREGDTFRAGDGVYIVMPEDLFEITEINNIVGNPIKIVNSIREILNNQEQYKDS